MKTTFCPCCKGFGFLKIYRNKDLTVLRELILQDYAYEKVLCGHCQGEKTIVVEIDDEGTW